MNILKYKIINSPVGNLKIVVQDNTLVAILWDVERPNRVRLEEMIEDTNDPVILEVENQLKEYFLNKRTIFHLPLMAHGTPFQQEVWKLLNEIPFGKTLTYKEIAIKLNNPKAVRAVGGAIGRNPISIIIPCHRVVGSNKSLTGFAGGLNRKQILLNLELLDVVLKH